MVPLADATEGDGKSIGLLHVWILGSGKVTTKLSSHQSSGHGYLGPIYRQGLIPLAIPTSTG